MGFWWIVAHQANHVTFIQLAPECPVCAIITQTNEGVVVTMSLGLQHGCLVHFIVPSSSTIAVLDA